MTPPENPAGAYVPNPTPTAAQRNEAIDAIERLPVILRLLITPLTNTQLETKYKNWTVRQIVHHLADSHLNGVQRFKLALTEENPRIVIYKQTPWVELPDARELDPKVSIDLLGALNARWIMLLRGMTDEQFSRGFHHPDQNRIVPLAEAIGLYGWHAKHHPAQIEWLGKTHQWYKES